MSQPVFTVIAGANGCGKSTLTQWSRTDFQQGAVLDPDAVAVGLRAASGKASEIEAGKEVIRAAEAFLLSRTSFSVETTLSGGTYIRMLARARELAYRTRIFYVGTDGVEINMARIRARVLKGGHHVPLEDQLRRYPRSYSNLAIALRPADECILYDNSSSIGHRTIGYKRADEPLVLLDPLPAWAEFLRA